MVKKTTLATLCLLLTFAFSCNDQSVIEQHDTVVPFAPIQLRLYHVILVHLPIHLS